MDCLDGCMSILFLLFLIAILGFILSNPVFWVILLCLFILFLWVGRETKE